MQKPISAADVFRTNLQALVERNGGNPNASAGELGFPQKTIARWLSGERTPGLREVQKLADKVGVEAWHLLVPSLDVTNPPLLARDAEQLRRILAQLRSLPFK